MRQHAQDVSVLLPLVLAILSPVAFTYVYAYGIHTSSFILIHIVVALYSVGLAVWLLRLRLTYSAVGILSRMVLLVAVPVGWLLITVLVFEFPPFLPIVQDVVVGYASVWEANAWIRVNLLLYFFVVVALSMAIETGVRLIGTLRTRLGVN